MGLVECGGACQLDRSHCSTSCFGVATDVVGEPGVGVLADFAHSSFSLPLAPPQHISAAPHATDRFS